MIPFTYICNVEKFCQHIEKLLAQHDYVVVPNLGGFVVQVQSAALLTDHITPPLSTIGFNPLMHHADGLLAIEISRSEQISYRLAMEYIEKQVESLKANVKSNRNRQFGNLGVFYQDEAGNLLFTPSVKVEFLPQNFELTDLYVSRKNYQTNGEKPTLTITLPSRRIFKYASVAAVVFGLFCISPSINDMRKTDSANLLNTTFYSSSPEPVAAKVPSNINDSLKIAKPLEQNNYHVIVASLASQKIADNFCDELISSDFPTAHVLPPTKIYRVAIQSFPDRDKAIRFMENLRKTDRRFDTAWVLCK